MLGPAETETPHGLCEFSMTQLLTSDVDILFQAALSSFSVKFTSISDKINVPQVSV